MADSSDHHQRRGGETVPAPDHPAWMRWIPDNVSLFALSIPATHDSITYTAPSGGLCETQLMDINEQMNAGIRGFDLRASRSKDPDRLEIWHGACKLYRTLDDVLKHMAAFVKSNPSETLILRLGDDGIGDGESDHDEGAKSMEALFELSRDKYKSQFWIPALVDDMGNPLPNPSTTFNGWLSPTLGEVRGKIVLLREAGWEDATGYETKFGLHRKQNDVHGIWDIKTGSGNDWTDTVREAVDEMRKANGAFGELSLPPTDPRDGMTIIGLDAVGLNVWEYPYRTSANVNKEIYRFLVGYSDEDNDGTVFGSFKGKSTGFVSMDFPGPGIIDAIIAHNLWLAKSPADVGRDFDKLFENTWYAIEEDRPDDNNSKDDARDRLIAFRDFWRRFLPTYKWQVSVMNTDGHPTARATNVRYYPSYAAELKANDWHVFFYTDQQPAPVAPSKSTLQTFVDAHPWTAGGPEYRARTMLNRLTAKWPDVDWTVLTYLHTPFGFDNLAVDGIAGVDVLSKSINDMRYYVSGIRKPPPPTPIADAGGTYESDEGIGVLLSPGAGTHSGGTNTLQWRWDFDGNGVYDTERGVSTYVFRKQDDYDGAVRMEAWNGLATATDDASVIFNNVAPTLYPTSGTSFTSEGSQARINGFISDRGTDSMTVSIDWNGDGVDDTTSNLAFSGEKCSFSPTEYCTTFSEKFTYQDNGPASTGGEIAARITVMDDDLGVDTHTHPIFVQNQGPSVGAVNLISTATGQPINASDRIDPNTEVQLSVVWFDVGAADTHSARIEWGDGQTTPFQFPTKPLVAKHTYTTTGQRQIKVVVKDDDDDLTTRDSVLFNVGAPPPPPTVSPIAKGIMLQKGQEGIQPVILDASQSTVDPNRTAQYRWDFNGDGTWDTDYSSSDSLLWEGPNPSRPNEFKTNKARLEVFDGTESNIDEGIEIEILNVAPTVSATITDSEEGGLSLLTVNITDPGWEVRIVQVEYGDGEEGIPQEERVLAADTKSITFRHVYEIDSQERNPKMFPVNVYAFDQDGGVGSATIQASVLNVLPTVVIDDITTAEGNRVEPIPPNTNYSFVAGEEITLQGRAFDPGINDHVSIAIDWGDGNTTVIPGAWEPDREGTHPFSARHIYEATGDRDIVVRVTDVIGGFDTVTNNLTVSNALIQNTNQTEDPGEEEFFILEDVLKEGQPSQVSRQVNIVPEEEPVIEAFCQGQAATIVGTQGNDEIDGTIGDDIIASLGGDDTVRGLDGNDIICLGDGADKGIGGDGNDTIIGGIGNDILKGGKGKDILMGEAGDDILKGKNGKDDLFGGIGNDLLKGGNGKDQLNGGTGVDKCKGGRGRDFASQCEILKSIP